MSASDELEDSRNEPAAQNNLKLLAAVKALRDSNRASEHAAALEVVTEIVRGRYSRKCLTKGRRISVEDAPVQEVVQNFLAAVVPTQSKLDLNAKHPERFLAKVLPNVIADSFRKRAKNAGRERSGDEEAYAAATEQLAVEPDEFVEAAPTLMPLTAEQEQRDIERITEWPLEQRAAWMKVDRFPTTARTLCQQTLLADGQSSVASEPLTPQEAAVLISQRGVLCELFAGRELVSNLPTGPDFYDEWLKRARNEYCRDGDVIRFSPTEDEHVRSWDEGPYLLAVSGQWTRASAETQQFIRRRRCKRSRTMPLNALDAFPPANLRPDDSPSRKAEVIAQSVTKWTVGAQAKWWREERLKFFNLKSLDQLIEHYRREANHE